MHKDQNKDFFSYPWNGLEDYLKSEGLKKLSLLGYGSLMNADSSSLTFKNEQRVPVIGTNVKRVFDYPLTEHAYQRYGPPEKEIENAALNVYRTDLETDEVNGILQSVRIEELDSLRKRELNYSLVRTHARNWFTNEKIEEPVFLLSYQSHSSNVLPHMVYLDVCMKGAKSISGEFLDFFLNSTYLVDRKTLLADWIKKNHRNE